MAQISEKAQSALDLTSRIPDREQTQLESIRQNSQTVIAQKTTWVDAQPTAATEIAENVMQASAGIAEVNSDVAQSSTFSREIAVDIAEVNCTAGTTTGNSSTVSASVGDLTRQAEDLKVRIGEPR